MAEAVYELLTSDLPETTPTTVSTPPFPTKDKTTLEYLDRLSTLSVPALTSTESEALEHESSSLLRSLQALAKRSYKSIDTSTDSLAHVQQSLPQITTHAASLHSALPGLSRDVSRFAEKYSRAGDNALLERRRRALRLADNVDRLSGMLELPTLLTSTIAASASTAAGTAVGAASSANAQYASALDLYAHIRRLQRLFPDSPLVAALGTQAEAAMRGMTSNLILALRAQSLKLASAMRLIGLLRRIAPELDEPGAAKGWSSQPSEGALGALFLVCRLGNLNGMLDALAPLKELAEQDLAEAGKATGNAQSGGHTERYLKRYIEIFREQCFSIISMYKSIFPASLPQPGTSAETGTAPETDEQSSAPAIPSALATFTAHLIDTLMSTLKTYLPQVTDQSARDSLLTQVLYCAGSLGRLGGDFGLALAVLEEEIAEEQGKNATEEGNPEWVEAMKKHRVQASRLELLASGVGTGKGGAGVTSLRSEVVVSP